MARIIWSRGALLRIREIRSYIKQFNPAAASRTAARLLAAGDSLSEFPLRGRAVGDGYRELPSVRPYVTVYEVQDDRVVILHIRHSAQLTEE